MNKNIELLVNLLKKAAKENCKDCCNCKYHDYSRHGEDCDVYMYAEAIYEELQSNKYADKNSFDKGYKKGYMKGFNAGVMSFKSLLEPKLPEVTEVNKNNNFVDRQLSSPCLNCDFYKKYLAGGQPYIGDSPCQWCNNQPGKISFSTTVTTTGTKIDKGEK